MKIHTESSVQLLKEIQEKSNIIWASKDQPMFFNESRMSKYLNNFICLNSWGESELTTNGYVNPLSSKLVSSEEFLAECIRIAPKKEEKS